MQWKLIAVAYTLRTYWNQFSLGKICKQEAFSFDNSHTSFLWPEYFIDFLCERWIPCQALTRLWHLSCVYITPKDSTLQYKRCVHLWNNFPCIITLVMFKDFQFSWTSHTLWPWVRRWSNLLDITWTTL